MRGFLAFFTALVAALWLVSGRSAPLSSVTGVVKHVDASIGISVANDQTEPSGLGISLRDSTKFDIDPATIAPGMTVTVTYRVVGERHPIAEAVRTSVRETR